MLVPGHDISPVKQDFDPSYVSLGYCQGTRATIAPLGTSGPAGHCVVHMLPSWVGSPPLGVCISLSGTMKVRSHGRSFRFDLSSYVLSPVSKVCGKLSNRNLPSTTGR